MDLIENLKQAVAILESSRLIVDEASLKKPLDSLEKSVSKFISDAGPFKDLQWEDYFLLADALKKINRGKLDSFNSAIQSTGLMLPAVTAAQKRDFALKATKKGVAREIIAEINKSPEDVLRDRLYSMALSRNVSQEVHNLSEKDLKSLLKFSKIKEKKIKRSGKTIFDRVASEESLVNHLNEVRFRIE